MVLKKKITRITDKLKVKDEVENLGPQAKEKRVIEKQISDKCSKRA